MQSITIGDRAVGPGEPTFVIAEAGSNHNGDLATAKALIDVAADAGADAVKFQTFRASTMYPEHSGSAEYLDSDELLYDMVREMEMPYEWIPQLAEYCADVDIMFISTPTDSRAVDELRPYVPVYKIASFTMSHHRFLEYVADKQKPIILSTGTHEMIEVRETLELLRNAGAEDVIPLQCTSAYPAPLESLNIGVIERYAREFDLPAGLSDHSLDPVIAPVTAVGIGASVIEKHFTLDKNMEGPDHQFALEPDGLARLVAAVRDAEKAVGSENKTVDIVERELHDIARRRIHATSDITVGETLTKDNIAVLRSGKNRNGLEPKFYEEILGMTAVNMINVGDGVLWEDLEFDIKSGGA